MAFVILCSFLSLPHVTVYPAKLSKPWNVTATVPSSAIIAVMQSAYIFAVRLVSVTFVDSPDLTIPPQLLYGTNNRIQYVDVLLAYIFIGVTVCFHKASYRVYPVSAFLRMAFKHFRPPNITRCPTFPEICFLTNRISAF